MGSVPVVSTSTTTNSPPAFARSANVSTESVSGSMYGMSLVLPTSSRSFSWISMSGSSERWPNRIASAITSSGRILTPASTIMMASRVPDTTRSSSDSCELGVGRVEDELPVDPADAHGADGTLERDLADRERGGRGDGAENVRVVLLVRGQDRDHELDVVLVALGEQRADRAVGEARCERRGLGHAAFALDEAAGDLAGGVHPLLELDGEREEVETGPRLGAVGGPEDHGVAVAQGDGAAGKAGELAGLEGKGSTAELDLERGGLGHGVTTSLVVHGGATCGAWAPGFA